MKLGTLICSVALSASMAVGVGVAVSAGANADQVTAATSTTVYYAVPSATVGSYSVKCNTNHQGDAENWHQYDMSRDGSKTYNGNPIYKVTFTDTYDGLGKLQFQLYNGSSWVSQIEPISGWTSVGTYNGKLIEHANPTNWVSYNYDETVTKYPVKDGTKGSAIGTDKVLHGTTYTAPSNAPYESGYEFKGWFSNEACSTPYTSSTINAATSIYAKYEAAGTYSGTIHLDLKNSGWAGAAANYAVLLMDKTTYSTEQDAWSTYVMGTASGEHLVDIPYSGLNFEPLTITIVRYDPEYSQSDWNTQKWPTDGSKWGQTTDVDYNEMIRIGNSYTEGKNNAYGGYPKVIGGVSPAWADITYLTTIKSNGSHNVEYYSTAVTLAANAEFKIQIAPYADGDYCGNYTTHSSITSSFGTGTSGNIKANVAGTYAFYFDGLANDGAGSVYITTVALAQADEWSQYFLGHSGCDASGKNLPSGWDDCATEYGKLVGGAKDIIYAASADEHGSYVEQAVARYDHAVAGHPTLEKFIKNSSDVVRAAHSPAIVFGTTSDQTTMITVIVIASITSVSLIGGFFYIRKRKLG